MLINFHCSLYNFGEEEKKEKQKLHPYLILQEFLGERENWC